MENILRMYAVCLERDGLKFLMDIVQVKNQCGFSTSIRTHTDK